MKLLCRRGEDVRFERTVVDEYMIKIGMLIGWSGRRRHTVPSLPNGKRRNFGLAVD